MTEKEVEEGRRRRSRAAGAATDCMQDADEQSHQRVVKSSELSLRYRSKQKTPVFFILFFIDKGRVRGGVFTAVTTSSTLNLYANGYV